MQEESGGFGREQSLGRGCWWPGEGSSLQSHTEDTKLDLEASLKRKGRNKVVGKHIREERERRQEERQMEQCRKKDRNADIEIGEERRGRKPEQKPREIKKIQKGGKLQKH